CQLLPHGSRWREAHAVGMGAARQFPRVPEVRRARVQRVRQVRLHLPLVQLRAMNLPGRPDSAANARSRFRLRASSDFSAKKYRRTSFLRLGVSAFHAAYAFAFPASGILNHDGIGRAGPPRYAVSNDRRTRTRSPDFVPEAFRTVPCRYR